MNRWSNKETKKKLRHILRKLYETSLTSVPSDVKSALEQAKINEDSKIAKLNLDITLNNLKMSREKSLPICSDTGYPVFWIKIGRETLHWSQRLISTLPRLIVEETESLTKDGLLRPTMINPFNRANPGTNVGEGLPVVHYDFIKSDRIEIICAPKGGGTEIFGAFFCTYVYAEGIKRIKDFVLNAVKEADLYGKACPPNIVGVGVGGTAEQCMQLAKEAAVFRPIGKSHPNEKIATLERELLTAINAIGIGPLSMGGETTALAVHILYAYSHLAGFPVAIAIQCPAARLYVAHLKKNGFEFTERPSPTIWGGKKK